MTGTAAEQKLLGAVVLAPREFRNTEGLVAGDDFSDERLGRVWSGIGQMLATGKPVDQVTVQDMFAVWDVRGLSVTSTFEWTVDVLPYAAAEYARSVRTDAVRRALREAVTAAQERLRDGDEPVDVATSVITGLQAVVDGASSGLLVAKTLGEILAGSDSYDWVIPNLLERRDRLVLTGAEGAGKTTFVRQLAVLASAGIHPTTFERIDPVRVLVVDAENTERQWRRAVRWTVRRAKESGAVNPEEAIHVVAGNRIDITKGSHLGEIHRLIDRHKPDVLFIGPLYKLVPKAINNDDDAAPLIVGLDSLRERDIALVMEAHAGKGTSIAGERDLRPRGSAALLGWPEFGMGLQHMPDNPDMVQMVRWRGDRDERAWPKYLMRGGDWPWTPA